PVLGVGPKDGDAAKVLNDCGAGVMVGFGEEVEMGLFASDLQRSYNNSDVNFYSRKFLTHQIVMVMNAISK
ncbi:MAG: glycosyl transferase family 1, partial [Marinilabiliales bacterium]